MPLLDQNMQPIEAQDFHKDLLVKPPERRGSDQESPSGLDTILASVRSESPIAAYVTDLRNSVYYDPDKSEEGFDIVQASMDAGLSDEQFDDVMHIRNRKSFDIWMDQYQQEQRDERTLAASGLFGFVAQFGAGLLSPTSLLPGGALVKTGKLGLSAGKSALSIGAWTGTAAAIDEVALNQFQIDRSAGESAAAIGGSVLLGALLGGGMAKYLNNHQINSLAMELQGHIYKGDVDGEDVGEQISRYVNGNSSVGAAANTIESIENNTIAGKTAQKLAKLTLSNPLLRGLQSPSPVVRDAVTKLVENPIYLKKNLDGHASMLSVETAIKEWDRGALAQGMEGYKGAYKAYRRAGGKLNQADFAERVAKAMRRGDVDPDGDPHVQQAAKIWREKVFDPLKDMAIQAGLLPEDVQPANAISYLSRVYNKPLIEADEEGFKRMVRDWANGAVREDIRRARAAGDRRLGDVDREIQELKVNQLREEEAFKRRQQRKPESLPDGLEPDDLQGMINVVQGPRPQQPETLMQFLRRRGGLYDPDGELVALGINHKSQPGFLRKTRRETMSKEGGWDLDTAARMAWEEGFIRSPDRPTVAEFLDALSDDFSGMRRVVREVDEELAQAADNYDDLIRALDELDINVGEKDPLKRFRNVKEHLTTESVLRRFVDARKHQMQMRIGKLQERLAQIEGAVGQRPLIEDDIDFDDLSKMELEEEVEHVVESIWRKVTGRPDLEEETGLTAFRKRLPESKRGPMKSRTFDIDDKILEPWLENNVEAVARRYARVMSADIELTRNFGSANMEGLVTKISDDYEKLRALETDPKKRQALSKREKSDLADINAMRDLLRGQFEPDKQATLFARIVNLANIFNYTRALGGVSISSLPDIARPMMVHGLSRYMKDGIKPLMAHRKAWKMSVKEAHLAGTVVEKTLQSRMANWSEIADPYAQFSPFENFMQNAASVFSKVNGLTYWDDFMKSVASVMTQNRLIENMHNITKLDGKERSYMAYLGIDEATSSALKKELSRHAEKIVGVWVATTEKWESKHAVRMFRAALNKDVDSIIVTKGIGDVPVFAHTPTGRLLLQFKSFGLASHQRVLMRGMQEDAKSLTAGMVFATTIGAAVSALKNIESNRDLSDNPGTWIAEGIDRSGLMTVFFELNNTYEKVGGTGIYGGLQKAFPDRDQSGRASRYASRNVVSSMLGPSMGPAEDFARLLYAMHQGDLTPGDITAIRRLVPFSTLPFVRSVLEYGILPPLKDAVR
ncbi:hypothetical protein SAMN04488056_1032 [Cohaesibacter marisflavi]|uniref:Uncharacterized protein n=1 Tax=Cohaesibacter marisflavi TaxID=655353 RepID=A0A1I5E2S7_9HYPH|nr:hypothetical protein [Cohaesibacter marisflavi]SFO05835.1 hypothetical protein SAMN04488056_1032 [Cohaesibacter marisflavi]